MKIITAAKDYLVEIEIRKYSPRTITVAKTKLQRFAAYCQEELEIESMEDVTPRAIKLYTQYMMRKGYKGTTINGTLKTLKTFVQYAYEEGFGGFDTRRGGFKAVKQEKPVITAFSRKDVKRMLDNCKGLDYFSVRDHALLTLFFETGIRCREALTIKPENIKDDYIIVDGKNNKQRVVPITPLLRKAFIRYDRVKEAFFDGKYTDNVYFLSRTGKELHNVNVLTMMKKRGEGIIGIRVSPHTCRHFFAQQQVKMGTDLYTISRLLGHESVAITQIYLNSLKDEDIIKMTKNNSVLMNM